MEIKITENKIEIGAYITPINTVSYYVSPSKDSVTYYINKIETLSSRIDRTTVNGTQMTTDNIAELLSPLFFLDTSGDASLQAEIDRIEEKLDSIIGGVNYLSNVNFKTNTSNWISARNHTVATNTNKPNVSINNSLAITSTGAGGISTGYVIQQLKRQQIVSGQTYTFSFWVKSSVAMSLHMEFQGGSGLLNKEITPEWVFIKNTFKAKSNSNILYLWLTRSGIVYINNPQLEIGSLATDCSDIQDQLDALSTRVTALEN